ncbi:MAG: hypothetical protein AB1487_05645 [Thermodesulfobacteriota bacterium]
MHTIFSLDNAVLGRLDATSASITFRNLLWCEAVRIGLSPNNVIISLHTNISDGGIDARVDGSPTVDSALVGGLTYFQIKTGESFKPWQKSNLKRELFGDPRAEPSRKTLLSGIRGCLRSRGRYVIITFGQDLIPKQQSEAVSTLKQLLEACGYKKPKVDVWGQSQLLGLIIPFPSLTLELLDRTNLPFLNHNSWKAREDMRPQLHLGTAQSEVINTIQNALREIKFQHIRVIGEPGIGKTRLVLEALSVDDLAPTVIYVPHAEDFQRSPLFNDLLRGDTSYYAILVIDECIERDRASIWNALKGKKNIRLVTVDHGPELSRDSEMLVIECPALPEDQIKEIITSYLPKQMDVSHWTQWCDGSPRVAHAVGENLQHNPDDLLKPPATVPMWERFVAGYEKLDSKNAQDSLIVLRHLSLFTRFGFEDPVSGESQFICELVRDMEPSITWPRFQEIVGRLRKRRILQGRCTLFIVPKALHIYLWIDYWNNYGRGFNFKSFFERVPSQVRHWFLQLFIYAHASPVAINVVKNILSPSGPFSRQEFLVSEDGTRFLDYLAEADPAGTLSVLERTFGNWLQEELKQWDTGRQNIVWALEKIAVWREHLLRAANLLVKFALSENASNANNSTGMLVGLFKVGIGWAATQASPEDRFPIIQDLLASNDRVNKDLGLKLCKSWLNTHGGIRMIGAEYQGLRPPIEFWKPKTYGEVFNAWRFVWRHLYSVSRTWVSEQRQEANRMLIEAGFRLIHYSSVSDEVMDTLFELSDDSATDIRYMTHAIIMKLRFRKEKMPKGILGRLRKLDKKITGSSFWGRFNRYVLNTTWDEDYDDKGSDIKQSNMPSRRIRKLASEVAADASLFSKYLPQFVISDGHRLYEFGLRMSEMLPSSETVNAVIAAQLQALPSKQTQFIGGFFFGLKQRALEIWEGAIKRLLDDGSSKDIGVDIIIRSGLSKNIIQRLIELSKRGLVNSIVFSRLAWQAKEDNIPQELVEEVLTVLTTSSDNDALRIAIELTHYYFFNREQPRSCDENLLFRLLTNDKFFDRDYENMTGSHWYVIASGFRDRFPGRDIELFSVIMSHLEVMSSLRSSSYPLRIADEIAKVHPDATWSIISTLLDTKERISFYLTSWLGNELGFEEHSQPGAISFFDPQIVMNWALQDSKKRAWRLIRCLPKTLNEAEGGKLTKLFLEAFGDDEELSDSLIGHFWTGGWTGPESAYLSRKRDKARQWLSETKSGKVLSWLYRYIENLSERIKGAELDEERRF